MELIDYDVCQVVHFMNMFRPQGAAYLPETAAKILSRYQFAKPPTLDDLQKDSVKFQIGKFEEIQIAEFGVYGDGIIASGKCPTEALEQFLLDVTSFVAKEIGLISILEHRNEWHFESKIVVQSKVDLGAFIVSSAEALIRKTIEEKIGVAFQPSGIVMDCDPGEIKLRRKPARMFIERKIGFKFEENLFLCIAPLKTKDQIELLSNLEREAGGH
jgi:hypothetical protein